MYGICAKCIFNGDIIKLIKYNMVKIKHLGLIVILGLFASCSEHNPNCPKLAKIHKIEK